MSDDTTVVPGKSLWGIALGMPRDTALARLQTRFARYGTAAKRTPSHRHKDGFVVDGWHHEAGLEKTREIEVLSRNGIVVQVRVWGENQGGDLRLTFGELVRRYRLTQRVYAFIDPEGGGYVTFYYDDVARGVTYSKGLQDYFLLTYRPDAITVHRPGVPLVPIEAELRGKRETNEITRAFQDEADLKRFEERNRRRP